MGRVKRQEGRDKLQEGSSIYRRIVGQAFSSLFGNDDCVLVLFHVIVLSLDKLIAR